MKNNMMSYSYAKHARGWSIINLPSLLGNSPRSRLIKFTVEVIRTRLDRVYLEALESRAKTPSVRVSADEVSALQEELESLYAEILPVAQMTTEQQFLEPALKSFAAKNNRELARSAQATSYVSGGDISASFQADGADSRMS